MSMNVMSLDTAALAPKPQFPAPECAGHSVQFYEEDDALLDELGRFIGGALVAGDAAIVIATKSHRTGLDQRLKKQGFDVTKAARQGRYVALDAAETLSKFMVDGAPQELIFNDVIGEHILRARSAAGSARPVAMFGEMVALLWAEGNRAGVVRLEQLWQGLLKTQPFSLRCAYPLSGFHREEHGEWFMKICGEHSLVIPSEDYTTLATEEHRLRNIAYLQQRSSALAGVTALRESEERFRLLVNAVQDYAIFTLDARGRVDSWNMGAERIKGYQPAEIIGKHFSCFYPEESRRAGEPARALEIATTEGHWEAEGWRVRKDGTLFWANAVITARKDDTGNLIGFSKVTRDFTEQMLAKRSLEESRRQLEDSEQSLRKLSLHLLRTQDEERRRIGRDLHDSLGQYLSVLKMRLDSFKSLDKTADLDTAKQDIAECADLAEESIKEVRTISYLLYPPMLEEMGLRSAVRWYLDGFTKRSGIQTSFDISPDFGRVPRDIEVAIFRVLQESLTNVHRHSGSPTADVKVLISDGTLILEVKDKGKGMPSGNLAEAGQDHGTHGVGLRGMDERMRHLGGRIDFHSTPTGTRVVATVPLESPSLAAAASA
jgi:PAS domain S-box-containing protein